MKNQKCIEMVALNFKTEIFKNVSLQNGKFCAQTFYDSPKIENQNYMLSLLFHSKSMKRQIFFYMPSIYLSLIKF